MSRKIVDCIILINSNGMEDLNKKVRNFLDDGYEPLGPASSGGSGTFTHHVAITMVKYSDGYEGPREL